MITDKEIRHVAKSALHDLISYHDGFPYWDRDQDDWALVYESVYWSEIALLKPFICGG